MMQMMQKRNIPRVGFTIVEVVIVMLMMGIMMAATAPQYYNATTYYAADSAAQRIKADLEWARREARLKSTNQTVDFYTNTDRYVMTGVSPLNGGGGNNTVEIARRYSATVDKAEFGVNPTSSVTFNAFGSADKAGEIKVSCGRHSRTILISSGTGVIKVQ